MTLTKRQRIAGWIGLDSERRRRAAAAETLARITARLSPPRHSNIFAGSPAAAAIWSKALSAELAKSATFNSTFGLSKVHYDGHGGFVGVELLS